MFFTQKEQAELLAEFYRDVLDALGGDYSEWFMPYSGLCENLKFWCSVYKNFSKPETKSLTDKQYELFFNAYRKKYYPFNINFEDYENECVEHILYYNALRIEWLEKHAARKSS